MADFAAIQQLLARYCFAHDSRDPAMLATTFARDAELMGLKGRDVIAARFGEAYKTLTARRRHMLSNIMILEDGEDRAVVQSYLTLYLIRGDTLETHLTGVYRDTVVREDGEWKLFSREATMDTPYDPGDARPATAGSYSGAQIAEGEGPRG